MGRFLAGVVGATVALASAAMFYGAWWYCAETYGFLWGFGFGWLPSIILAIPLGFVGVACLEYAQGD
jgi:hypothetical protein